MVHNISNCIKLKLNIFLCDKRTVLQRTKLIEMDFQNVKSIIPTRTPDSLHINVVFMFEKSRKGHGNTITVGGDEYRMMINDFLRPAQRFKIVLRLGSKKMKPHL